MNRTTMAITLIVVSLGVSGCNTSQPKPMAIEDVLASLGRGFVKMKQAQLKANDEKEFMTGLVPAEAEVSFNISHAKTENGKLYVELSPIPISTPVEGKAGAEGSISSTRTIGNTITVKFKSLLFGSTTTTTAKNGDVTVSIQGLTDPKLLLNIYNTLRILGITTAHEPNMPNNSIDGPH